MNRFEELVITLWNKGESTEQIAQEIGEDEGIIQDIVECQRNYEETVCH
jgi:hypothetical protein